MAKYKTGIESKKKILDSAKRLFYRHGYARTTIAMIAAEAGVPKGLIAYYYKKEQLLTAIHEAFVLSIFEAIRQQLGDDINPMQQHLLFLQLFGQVVYCDESNLALYRHIVDGDMMSPTIMELVDSSLMRAIGQFAGDIPPEECQMLITAQYGAHREIIRTYLTPSDPLKCRRLFFWTGTVAFRLAGVERAVIDDAIHAVDGLLDSFDNSAIHFTI